MKDGRYQISGQVLNAPPWAFQEYGHFFIEVFWHTDMWVRQVAYQVNGHGVFTRQRFNGTWTAWEPFATATPPQEFELPLASGVTACGRCVYSKTQDGIVTVHGAVNISNYSSGMVFATLPAGFRPSAPSEEPASYAKVGSRLPGAINVLAGGPILAYQDDSAVVYCTFNISFVAGN